MAGTLSPTNTDFPNQARQAALRTRILLFVLTIAVGLFMFDLFHIRGLMPGGIPFYALLFGGIGIALYLNRSRRYLLSSCVALLTFNSVLFAFALAANVLLPLFILIGVLSLVIVPFSYTVVRWFFVFLSYLMFCFCLFTDFQIFPTDVDPAGRTILFFVTVTTAMFCLVVVLQSYINLNRATESSLEQQRRDLLQVTNDLQTSQDRLRLVIKGSRAGVYEWNVKTNALFVSDEWKHILGFAPHELRDFSIEDLAGLMHPDDVEELQRQINEHFKEKKPFQNESRRRQKNGTYRWIFDSGLSRLDENGNIEVVVGSIIDITDRKNAEIGMIDQNELLKKTNQELDTLVHNASHDLRSPLSSVLGLLTISELAASKEEILAYHGMIRERVQKLDNFVTEVLAYSRNSHHEVISAPVELTSLVREIVEELRYADSNVNIDFSNVEEITIYTDHTRLKTALSNLIGNSIKYSDPNREEPFIKLEASVSGGECMIGIHDNGIGIGAEHLQKVFEMFYRATDNSSGSGLGLFITKEMIEKLGGSIQIQSTPRVGTSVFVRLPTT